MCVYWVLGQSLASVAAMLSLLCGRALQIATNSRSSSLNKRTHPLTLLCLWLFSTNTVRQTIHRTWLYSKRLDSTRLYSVSENRGWDSASDSTSDSTSEAMNFLLRLNWTTKVFFGLNSQYNQFESESNRLEISFNALLVTKLIVGFDRR